ncbi:hypothetical protein GXW71_24505 [Roseomonas hellenica]|uniref:Uncharacterized protein n=1 Tax=Plastoroseomonas hellenica TaxID=2687306 RepID=A0ABS5F4W9_9PROT|nr:hypothetical protein [Plastoroseomonas hellenica]MBR0667541.1 hypothetical protein [Plastoroseomonas hellenica]
MARLRLRMEVTQSLFDSAVFNRYYLRTGNLNAGGRVPVSPAGSPDHSDRKYGTAPGHPPDRASFLPIPARQAGGSAFPRSTLLLI